MENKEIIEENKEAEKELDVEKLTEKERKTFYPTDIILTTIYDL